VYPALHSHALGLTERLFRHLRRYGRQPPAVERCGLAWIWFECEPPVHVREYYRYCVQLFRNALLVTDQRVDLVFGDCVAAGPDAKRVMFQLEHTLVKPGGRDSQHASAGSVAQPNSAGEYYLVRIDNQAALSAADVIVEYSQPNVENIVRAGIHAAYVSKMICLAPLLYAPSFGQSSRQNEAISTFADLRQQRRASLLQKARREGVPLRNVRGVYDGEALRALYQNTKLLINVHQTDHHHTFEELRVLPALLCGVIVVSETVPLRQQIPYQRFIVWADYGELVATTRQILADYDDHWRRIFCDPSLIETLEQMRQRNEQAVALALHRLDRAPGDSGITDSVRQV